MIVEYKQALADRSSRRRRLGSTFVVVRVASAISSCLGLGLPFVQVGGSQRTAFGLIRSARLLGLVDGFVRSMLTTAVVLMPLLAALMVLLAAFTGTRRADRASSVLGCLMGFISLAVGCVALLVSREASTASLPGPLVCTGCGALLLLTTFAVTDTQRTN